MTATDDRPPTYDPYGHRWRERKTRRRQNVLDIVVVKRWICMRCGLRARQVLKLARLVSPAEFRETWQWKWQKKDDWQGYCNADVMAQPCLNCTTEET